MLETTERVLAILEEGNTVNLCVPRLNLDVRNHIFFGLFCHLIICTYNFYALEILFFVYLNHICRQHHLSHKYPCSSQLPTVMHCALTQS